MDNFYQKMVENSFFVPKSSNYFWVYDMEWLAQDKIKSKCTNKDITPFAVTAGGDVWVFYNDRVVFCGLDGECTYYADNLENAVFRSVIGYLSDFGFDPDDPDDENEETEAFARKYIKEVTEVFAEAFSEDMLAELKRISELPLKEQGCGLNFISPAEADEIIKKCIKFELMDTDVFPSEKDELPALTSCDMSGYVFFTDDEMRDYAYKCAELADIHSASYEKYLSAAQAEEVKETLLYKGGYRDIFLYRMAEALYDGNLNHGTKKKTEADCTGACRKYYIGTDGKPTYCEEFLSGMSKEVYFRKFYLYEKNKVYAVSFTVYPIFRYLQTEVNDFSDDGTLLSYTWFEDNEIQFYEKYEYSDKLLKSCTELKSYHYGDERQLSLSFCLHRYDYSDGKIASVDRMRHYYNDPSPDISCTKEVKEKIYKYFKKNKLIG